MITLNEVKQHAARLAGLPEATRQAMSIGITLVGMLREQHDGEERMLGGELDYQVTQGQVEDYAVQLYSWITGATDHRPGWTTYPQLRLTDLPDSPLLTAVEQAARWVVDNEQTTIDAA